DERAHRLDRGPRRNRRRRRPHPRRAPVHRRPAQEGARPASRDRSAQWSRTALVTPAHVLLRTVGSFRADAPEETAKAPCSRQERQIFYFQSDVSRRLNDLRAAKRATQNSAGALGGCMAPWRLLKPKSRRLNGVRDAKCATQNSAGALGG